MANNNGNGKKNQQGGQSTTSEPQSQQPVNRRADVQDKHGNDQVKEVIKDKNAGNTPQETVLSRAQEDAELEQQSAQQQEWWREDDLAEHQAIEEEEEQSIAAASATEEDQAQTAASGGSEAARQAPAAAMAAAVLTEEEQLVAPELEEEEAVAQAELGQEEEEEQIVANKASDTDEQKAQKKTKKAEQIETAATEKALLARAVLEGRDVSQVDIAAESRKDLSSQEANALEEIQRQEAAGKGSEQAAILALADAKNLDEADKAAMLLGSGVDLDAKSVENESPQLQALLAAQQLPGSLGDYDKDAAELIGTNPLSERQTLQNVTNEIRMIAEQMHNHPALLDPNASIEAKSTALIETLAYSMDVPTRESLAVHPFTVLTDELIFEPRAMMEINKIAGSRRDIRQMGSFAVILWQITTDAARLELDALGNEKMINEQDFLSGMLTDMANKMYVDALSRPGW